MWLPQVITFPGVGISVYVESQAGQNKHDAVDRKCPNLYDNVDGFSLIMTKVDLMVALKEMSLGFIIIGLKTPNFMETLKTAFTTSQYQTKPVTNLIVKKIHGIYF